MRFMVLLKSDADSEAGKMPPPEYMERMHEFNAELAKAGLLETAEGLLPSSKGARVRFSRGGKRTITDGPFAEAKELVAGFWIWRVKTKEEALEWVKRIPMPSPDYEDVVELRQLFDAEDPDSACAPELREWQARLRREIEAQR
jgi:hypothetical protein